MPDKPSRRTDYVPVKLHAVSMAQGAQQPAAGAGALNSKPTKILVAVPPKYGNRPGNPPAPAGPPAQRPSPDHGATRAFTSRQSSSQPSDPWGNDDRRSVRLLPTRYRFGAALYDELVVAALPPSPGLGLGQRDPVRTAIEVWRGVAKFSRTLATRRATSAPDLGAVGVPAAGGAVPPAPSGAVSPADGGDVPPAVTRQQD